MAYYYHNQGPSASAYSKGGNSAPYYDPGDVTVAMPQGVTVEKTRWNWCATVWAAIAYFLCPHCLLFNFISLMCLGHAYSDHKSQDYERARYKRNCGIGWLVTSWVLGAAVLATIIALFVLNVANIAQLIQDALQSVTNN